MIVLTDFTEEPVSYQNTFANIAISLIKLSVNDFLSKLLGLACVWNITKYYLSNKMFICKTI